MTKSTHELNRNGNIGLTSPLLMMSTELLAASTPYHAEVDRRRCVFDDYKPNRISGSKDQLICWGIFVDSQLLVLLQAVLLEHWRIKSRGTFEQCCIS
ncbi:hypothetical protein Zmor_023613 [Zophobas morio]|uniref:Uncharacterized protein n=1 Tax=Zophobas morio TaxID=2755281 RepID=A0AA38HXK4_9CUCU|nr:hypothetical protein Zmor_023613 [Zophobas morio]